jgi:hypothetical protein
MAEFFLEILGGFLDEFFFWLLRHKFVQLVLLAAMLTGLLYLLKSLFGF